MHRTTKFFATSLVAFGTAAAVPNPVFADATLETIAGPGSVKEASHETNIRVDGVVATVTTTQTFTNASDKSAGIVHTFQLPNRAVVTELSVRPAGEKWSSAAVVDATAAITLAPHTPGAAPDLGLLRMVERDAPLPHRRGGGISTYELRVFPVTRKRPATVRIRWVAPLRYADGRLSLRIPTRGPNGRLARSRVALSVRPPMGVSRLGAVRGGGTLLSARHGAGTRRYRFDAPGHGDLAVEVTPLFKSTAPAVSFATVPIGAGFGALAVTVLAPLPKRPRSTGYERVFVLVDASLSLGHGGLTRAATMTRAVLRAAPSGARVEVIVFNHKATRVLGTLLPNLPDTRKIVARAIKKVTQRNGSDLGLALDMVKRLRDKDELPKVPPAGIVRGNGASTLIAIISDGLSPLELTGRRAIDRLGSDTIRDSEVFAITLVPNQAPLPTLTDGPLAELTKRTGGRSIAVRFNEVSSRGKTLAAELNGPIKLETVSMVATPGADIRGLALPRTVLAGGAAIGIGWYHGAPPKRLTIHAVRDRKPVSHVARRTRRGWRKNLGSLALALPSAADSMATVSLPSPTAAKLTAHDRLLRAATRFPSVTPAQSLVAVAGDAFSRQRLSLVKRWGSRLYRRHAAPSEHRPTHSFRAYSLRLPTMTHAVGGTATRRRTGTLDRKIVKRLVTTYVVPRARACYERALRRHRTMSGSLTVVMEIARGEVQFAEVRNSTISDAGLLTCLTRAAYSARVPRVALGAAPDQVSVVRYPLRLRVAGSRATVERGRPHKRVPVRLDGPLDGLPRR